MKQSNIKTSGEPAISVIIMLFLYAFVHFTLNKFLEGWGNPEKAFYFSIIILSLLTIFLVGVFQKLKEKIPFFYGYSDQLRGSNILTGMFFAITLTCTGTLILFLNNNILWKDIILPGNIFIYFILLLLVAIAEETLFRGYILRNLLKILPVFPSLLISSFVFGLFHVFNPDVSWIAVLNIIMGGIVMGSMYLKGKSLYMPIAFHFFWNIMLGPVLGFPVSGVKIASILQTEFRGSILISGGDFGFEASVLCTVLLLSAATLILSKVNTEKQIQVVEN